ncbi:FimV/HubP family polar landmark protein [Aliikangiella sp. IMCC44359]|uniref:FimV/HubP family polar landmark protein n=1 Tax=Aliikangiella sp. IMCC44359 TaxID=3459125 RepID=UPI00403AFE9B
MFRKFILLLISAASFYSGASLAVGLGEYKLKSGLNQPLKAEIKLLSASDLGDHEIHASLASMAEFEKVGVERLFALTDIVFTTKKNPNGSVIIDMTTREPIKEPFLNFLVELNWPNGRIIREYTFLLDPPVFDESASSTIQKSQATASKKKPTKTYTSSVSQSQDEVYTGGNTYGPVTANDTLWSIASKVRPSQQSSIHQTLVAIYRANPDAFGNGNINNLLRGKVLKIPDAASVSQVPHRAALQDVVMQNNQWQSGGARRIVGNTQDSSTSKTMDSEGRLTLATPKSDGSSDKNSGSIKARLEEIQSQLVNSQETSATLQTENDELRARLADALKKIESIQSESAVNISDTELAALSNSQANKDDTNSNVVEETLSTTEGLTSNESNDNQNSDSSNVADTSELVDSTDKAETPINSNENEVVQKTAEASTSTSTPALTKKPLFAPKKSFLDEVLESSGLIWGGVAFVALIVLGVFWRMRKRMEEEEFHDDLVASTGAGTVDATESFELPDVGDDMLVELDMDGEPEETTESDEENFDPLGEADIYIAYGKYEQAESLLLEAIDDNPIRSDLKVKLMECYAENDDKEKFESLAQEVSQAVDAQEWSEQITSLREQAWSAEDGEEGFDLPSTEDIFNEDEFSLDDEDTSSSVDLGSESEINDDEAEYDLDADGLADDEFDIDMDMGLEDEGAPAASEAVTQTLDTLDDDDFTLDDEDASESLDDFELDDEEETISIDDSDDISLDFEEDDDFGLDDDSEFESDSVTEGDAGDEIATKLDLARAYIDMGDSEGAKEILSEVISEGSDSQKDEAQALLERAE